MEGSSRLNSLSSSSRSAAKEEKSDESVGHKESCTRESSKEDELELAKAKMKEVREENARLKMMLEKIEKDYKSLQKRFLDSVNQEEAKNNSNNNAACSTIEDTELIVSLRLGTSPSTEPKKDDNNNIIISSFSKSAATEDHDEQLKCGLKLGLDYHLGGSKSGPTVEVSPENSLEERKNEDVSADETCPPSKASKTGRSEDDELSQQSNPKRARVSVRARCDTPTMNDGCQWRKYGQKIAKGNPCPRAYYRCTVAPACPVRKQVQRCAEDMSILITTYEGTHNHPLNVSATAMASTTSAAASMLLSGSSSSQPGLGLTPATTQPTNLHGLNVNLSRDISRTRPFYLPNTSSPTFPTITLDLTASTPSTPFNIFSSTFQSSPTPFPSKNLNFSSFESNNITPTLWGNGYLNNYGKLSYNKPHVGSLNLGGPAAQEQLYHSYLEKNHQQPLTETITKALTSDPSFQSVIAAAISSMVGGSGGTQDRGERLGQSLKWGESTVPAISSTPVSLNAKGCASTYLTQSSSSSSHSGSLNAVQPTSLPFSVSKTTSAIAKSGDQTKS